MEERLEQADRIRTAADAGDGDVRQPPRRIEQLASCLRADDGLQLPDDVRIGVRADRRSEAVVRAVRVRHPVPQRLVHGRAQRAIPGFDGDDGCAHQPHAADIGRLTLHVERAHINGAGQADAGAGRGRRHAVLPGAGLGDDPACTEPLREQDLAEGVVDLVRAGVREVLALEPDRRAPARAETRGLP